MTRSDETAGRAVQPGSPEEQPAAVPGPSTAVSGEREGHGRPKERERAVAKPGRNVPKWAILAVCCMAQFMVVLDISIVNVALPSMQRDFGMSPSGLQWVVNAYTLAFAGLLLFGGRAADLFGRRRVFVLGLALFTLASLGGGLAQNDLQLIVARAVQGLGGAVLAPATLTLLMTSFAEGRERFRALGAWGATAASGGALGALVGGVLTEVANWRWVLFVNVPIGVLLILGARIVLTESRGQVSHFRELDIPGTITVTGGLVLLVYGIVRTESSSWTATATLSILAAAVVLLAVFVVIEATSANPLVPLSVFRYPGLAVANSIAALLGAALFGLFFFLTLYFQEIQGFSPLRTGLAFLPMPLMIIVASQTVTRVIGRIGPRPIVIFGSAFAAGGLIWLSQMSLDGNYWAQVFGPTILIGFGFGCNMVAMTSAATAGVPPRQAGLASGLLNTGRQIGAAVGLAALSTIATHHSDNKLADGVARPDALASGYTLGLFVGGCIMASAIVVALLLPRVSRPQGPAPVPGQPTPQESPALAEV